jgi:hypothetical protein
MSSIEKSANGCLLVLDNSRGKRILQKAAADGAKSTLLGIFLNFGLAIVKVSAGLLGHSFALVADGLESSADVLSGLVVYFGLKIAVKPPDLDHPYGHGKAEPIAAVVVGLSLMAAAVAIIVESIHEIRVPHRLPAAYTLVVLAGILIVKELLFRHVGAVGDSIGSIAVRSDAWHHRSDAITSAFAFIGISVALLGGPGWESADDWAALCAPNLHRIERPHALKIPARRAEYSLTENVASPFQADQDKIIGRSHTPTSAWHGFILNSSGYHQLKVPGFRNVSPEAINNIGEIVGYASRYDGTVLVQRDLLSRMENSISLPSPGPVRQASLVSIKKELS